MASGHSGFRIIFNKSLRYNSRLKCCSAEISSGPCLAGNKNRLFDDSVVELEPFEFRRVLLDFVGFDKVDDVLDVWDICELFESLSSESALSDSMPASKAILGSKSSGSISRLALLSFHCYSAFKNFGPAPKFGHF